MAIAKKKISALSEELSVAFVVPEIRLHGIISEAKALLRTSSPADAANVYQVMGSAYQRLGRHAQAIEMHERAHALAKSSPIHLNNAACAYFEVGRVGEAIDCYVRAIEAPEADDRDRAIAYANLAEAFAMVGQLDDASDALRAAIERAEQPSRVDVPFVIARQAALIGEDAVALEFAARGLALVRAMPRGSLPALEFIEGTPRDVLEKVDLGGVRQVIARASQFPELAMLPSASRPVVRASNDEESGPRLLDEWTDLRAEATIAGMSGE